MVEVLELPTAEEMQVETVETVGAPGDAAEEGSQGVAAETQAEAATASIGLTSNNSWRLDLAANRWIIRDQANRKHARDIKEAEKRIADSSLEMLELTKELKALKKQREEQIGELYALKNRGPDYSETDADDNDDEDGEPCEYCYAEGEPSATTPVVGPTSATESAANVSNAPAPADPNAWRAVTAEALGLPKSICEALRENPDRTLATLGDISDWSNSGKLLIDIPKIGEGKAEKIREACDAYWAKHPGAKG